MTLVRYRPYTGTLALQDELNRMFDSLIRSTAVPNMSSDWSPVCDVRESETEFTVRAELPGVAKENVKINMVDNTLVLRGEKKQETEDKKGNWHHVERSYGTFERTFTLPSHVAAEKITARFQDGVLEIVIPKADEARPREIRIDS